MKTSHAFAMAVLTFSTAQVATSYLALVEMRKINIASNTFFSGIYLVGGVLIKQDFVQTNI